MKTSMRIDRLRRRIGTSITYRGPAFTLLWCAMHAVRLAQTKWFMAYRARQFDRRYGVDTAGLIEPAELGLAPREVELCVEYQPSTPELIAEVLAAQAIDFRDYVFVDLGTGKGVPLLVASMFPFQRIVGIEWSRQLSSIARENASRFRHRRQKCRAISVIDADAAAYELPNEPLVLFMFNPFKELLVRQVLNNLGDSLRRNPRHVVLVYYNPVCGQVLESSDFLRPVTRADSHPIAVYESHGAACQRSLRRPSGAMGCVELSGAATE